MFEKFSNYGMDEARDLNRQGDELVEPHELHGLNLEPSAVLEDALGGIEGHLKLELQIAVIRRSGEILFTTDKSFKLKHNDFIIVSEEFEIAENAVSNKAIFIQMNDNTCHISNISNASKTLGDVSGDNSIIRITRHNDTGKVSTSPFGICLSNIELFVNPINKTFMDLPLNMNDIFIAADSVSTTANIVQDVPNPINK